MAYDFESFYKQGSEFLPGNLEQIKLGLIAVILSRNVLIEDVPGMGKTTLVKFFAKSTGLEFRRIQFTNDLMPSDVIGVSIFSKENEKFIFRPGPIFGELILADELNRGTPKTQSALLQAMEEKAVSVDGELHRLPKKFCLFATQNPRGQFGTYPLPESQIDRFLFKFPMGKLNKNEEVKLLAKGARLESLNELSTLINKEELLSLESEVKKVVTSNFLLNYVADILQASRHQDAMAGLSPRAGLDLIDAAKAWAYLSKRDYVIPDDVQAVFPYVAGHRLFSTQSLSVNSEHKRAQDFVEKISFVNQA